MLKSSSRDSIGTSDSNMSQQRALSLSGSFDNQSIATSTISNFPTSSSLPDREYMLNIQMISCLILTRSLDLPDYLPSLLSSFLRHRHYYDINKLIITKTIQAFQESHQDRWEEFQSKFTNEQLIDLQGVGAAYYFA
jgi:hypothetical protein